MNPTNFSDSVADQKIKVRANRPSTIKNKIEKTEKEKKKDSKL